MQNVIQTFFNTLIIVKSISSLCEINISVQGGNDPREIKIKEDAQKQKQNQPNKNQEQQQKPKSKPQTQQTSRYYSKT